MTLYRCDEGGVGPKHRSGGCGKADIGRRVHRFCPELVEVKAGTKRSVPGSGEHHDVGAQRFASLLDPREGGGTHDIASRFVAKGPAPAPFARLLFEDRWWRLHHERSIPLFSRGRCCSQTLSGRAR